MKLKSATQELCYKFYGDPYISGKQCAENVFRFLFTKGACMLQWGSPFYYHICHNMRGLIMSN